MISITTFEKSDSILGEKLKKYTFVVISIKPKLQEIQIKIILNAI